MSSRDGSVPSRGGRPRVAVVGAGLAGLSTALQVVEAGGDVDLFSLLPARRAHSVAAQGGINGADPEDPAGDSPWQHFDDTVYGGDFLAHQPPVLAMCRKAPEIIDLLDRMGVMFNRTPEGRLDRRRFGGTRFRRTAFAGATTGQQILYALDDQVRRLEVAGRVRRFEGWEFVAPVLDGRGECVGLVAQDTRSMALSAFPAGAVVVASGGLGMVFGRSTNSMQSTGAAAAACYRAGALWANGEFIQVHPTALPGPDKMRLMSESIRGEGGRLWVPRGGRPWFFLEEWYPELGNLVPRDVATRAIHKVVVQMGLGVDGERAVYLDVRHLPRDVLERRLGSVLELYRKYTGVDPREAPMKVYPAVHYTMGGLWVDGDDMTSIPGLFAAGECQYQYHGANRLGANSLLSCIYDGFVAGPAAFRWAALREGRGRTGGTGGRQAAALEAARRACEEEFRRILAGDGPENAYDLHRELGGMMSDHVTVVRVNAELRTVLRRLGELALRWRRIGLRDRGLWVNQEAAFVRQLGLMIDLARLIAKGALLRDESRGAHYKPEFPERDDERWLRTTLARYRGCDEEPEIAYEPVDVSLLPPRPRVYGRTEAGAGTQAPPRAPDPAAAGGGVRRRPGSGGTGE